MQIDLLTVGIMAMVAEEKRRMISAHTKAPLAAAKARGTKIGGFRGVKVDDPARAASIASLTARSADQAGEIAPVIKDLRAAGTGTVREIAAIFNDRCVLAARGRLWSINQVHRLL